MIETLESIFGINGWLVIAIATTILSYFIYLQLVFKRNAVIEALSGIDIQLKQRANLIPNILRIANKFMQHEKELFSEVTRLRERMQKDYNPKDAKAVEKYIQDAQKLDQSMNGFMLKAENYPDLQSSQNMMQAQETYNEIEAQIAAARRFYNSAAINLKNLLDIFPISLIGKIGRIKPYAVYKADAESKKSINASDFLK